jgi:hypothetical protein
MGQNRITMKLKGPLANFTGFNWKSNCFLIENFASRAQGPVDNDNSAGPRVHHGLGQRRWLSSPERMLAGDAGH